LYEADESTSRKDGRITCDNLPRGNSPHFQRLEIPLESPQLLNVLRIHSYLLKGFKGFLSGHRVRFFLPEEKSEI